MPHGITQCYLPPGRGDIPSLTPTEAGTRLSDPGRDARLIYIAAGRVISPSPVPEQFVWPEKCFVIPLFTLCTIAYQY